MESDGSQVPIVDYLQQRGICDFLESGGLDCAGLGVYRGADGDGTVVTPTGYGTAWSLRAGGMAAPLPWLKLRYGYGFEADATPDRGRSLTMLDGDKHLISGGITLAPGPITVHVTYAHVVHGTNEVLAADSEGVTLALPGVPVNAVDTGTYGGATNHVGIAVDVAFDEIRKLAQKANDSGQ